MLIFIQNYWPHIALASGCATFVGLMFFRMARRADDFETTQDAPEAELDRRALRKKHWESL